MSSDFRYQFITDELNNITTTYYNPEKGDPIEFKVDKNLWKKVGLRITDQDIFPYKKLVRQMRFSIFQIKFQIYNIHTDESSKSKA